MCCGWIVVGVAAAGIMTAPANIDGNYTGSCGTSYCREAVVGCPHHVPASRILGKPTGVGYSVSYNYGLQPDGTKPVYQSAGSNSYNYGERMK